MNIQHASRTDRWLTPISILDKVKTVLGPIDLDPASEAFANTRVQAKSFYTREDDGLKHIWFGNVYLNPPGGKRGNRSLSQLFWAKLMSDVALGLVNQAIFMAFSAEALSVTQGRGHKALGDHVLCIPSKRIRFDDWEGSQGSAPSHSNVIAYVPGRQDQSYLFAQTFKGLGSIVMPYKGAM